MYFTNVDRYKKQFGSNISIWFCKSNLTIFLAQESTKQEEKGGKDRKGDRNSSNRKVRIAKDSHPLSSIQIWSSWRSCSWLLSNRVPWGLGFVLGLITEFTLLDRSKVLRLEVHTRPHPHTCAQRNTGYRSCCLHLAATPPWYQRSSTCCRFSREITADIIQSYLCSLNPIYTHVGRNSRVNSKSDVFEHILFSRRFIIKTFLMCFLLREIFLNILNM